MHMENFKCLSCGLGEIVYGIDFNVVMLLEKWASEFFVLNHNPNQHIESS